MSKDTYVGPGCTSSLALGPANGSPMKKKAKSDSNVEQWLASSLSCPSFPSAYVPRDGSEFSAGAFLQNPSQLSDPQKDWLHAMSVLSERPTQRMARDSAIPLNAYPDLGWQRTCWADPLWGLQSGDSMLFRPLDCSRESRTMPVTNASTISPDVYHWPGWAQSSMAVDPKETLAMSSLSPDLDTLQSVTMVTDHESARSSPEYDSHYSSITPTATSSQASSGRTLLGSNTSYGSSGGTDEITLMCDCCPHEQASSPAIYTGITPQPQSEFEAVDPRVSRFRGGLLASNFSIPKSVPLDCRPTTISEKSEATWDIPIEYLCQGGIRPDNDAASAYEPTVHDYSNQTGSRPNFSGQYSCQTLKPSDLFEQSADLHASELPTPNTDSEKKCLQLLKIQQIPDDDRAARPAEVPLQCHYSKDANYSPTSPVSCTSQLHHKDSRSSFRKLSSRSRRRACDDFLVRNKLAGMSYREIRARGHFTEAESTLRGRFRTLTKRKEQRVRKPQWHQKDVSSSFSTVSPYFLPTVYISFAIATINGLTYTRSSSLSKPSMRPRRASSMPPSMHQCLGKAAMRRRRSRSRSLGSRFRNGFTSGVGPTSLGMRRVGRNGMRCLRVGRYRGMRNG